MRTRLFSFLLHLANAHPPFAREEFYAVKDHLLYHYGERTGTHWQRIRKKCEGARGGPYGERGGCPGASCGECRGSGIYLEKWTLLETWRWGKYTFHRLLPTWAPYPETPDIEGHIEHHGVSARASREALLWLYLFLGKKDMFLAILTHGGCFSRCKWYPMLWTQKGVHLVVNFFEKRRRAARDKIRGKRRLEVGQETDEEEIPF